MSGILSLLHATLDEINQWRVNRLTYIDDKLIISIVEIIFLKVVIQKECVDENSLYLTVH